MPEQKKLLLYQADRSACWQARLMQPFYYFAKNHKDYRIEIDGGIRPEHLKNVRDFILWQRQYSGEVLSCCYQMRKTNPAVKMCWEADDSLIFGKTPNGKTLNVGPPTWNPAYATYKKRSVQDNIRRFLEVVDACFVATEPLKELYSNFCEKVYVLPNSLDFNVFGPGPDNSRLPVVCWVGSNTHKNDIALLKPALTRLAKDDDVYIKLFSADLKSPNTYTVPFVTISDYYKMLAQLEGVISVAPLAAVPFNKYKSNLRWLESSWQGMAVIASNFGPYQCIEHEKTGILVDHPNEWYDWIRYLLENEEFRLELVKNAQSEIREKYDISKNYILWKNAIDEILES